MLRIGILWFLAGQLFTGIQAQVNVAVDPVFEGYLHRQFDFWIGEWDVNLRMQDDDLGWKDAVSATARIYRILDGKAILELWNEKTFGKGIKGYSLRYYNIQKDTWELWLNWPGENRSGSSSLEGGFRHGRGDFFSETMVDDTTRMISRYSFNDITPNSLRWDDAYSRDGGETWSNNWIMEFSRARDLAPLFTHNQNILTYDDGNRCDLADFREFERLTGTWAGVVEIPGRDYVTDANMETFKVLDGCGVISFLEFLDGGELRQTFSLQTFNTYARRFEETILDNQPDTAVETYYGAKEEGMLVTVKYDQEEKMLTNKRREWVWDGDQIKLTIYTKAEGVERVIYEVSLTRTP